MEIYLLVMFFVIVISFVTGTILSIYNNIYLKNHIKNRNQEAVLNKTIRLDALDSFCFLLNNNQNRSVEISLEPVKKDENIVNNPPIPMPVVNIDEDIDII